MQLHLARCLCGIHMYIHTCTGLILHRRVCVANMQATEALSCLCLADMHTHVAQHVWLHVIVGSCNSKTCSACHMHRCALVARTSRILLLEKQGRCCACQFVRCLAFSKRDPFPTARRISHAISHLSLLHWVAWAKRPGWYGPSSAAKEDFLS